MRSITRWEPAPRQALASRTPPAVNVASSTTAHATTTPAGTTRGFGIAEFQAIGDMIADVLDGLAANGHDGNAEVEKAVNQRVRALCARFPIYQV